MPTVAGYGQEGFRKIVVASALAHGALILFALFVYKGEVKEFISPVYTVSLIAPPQFSSNASPTATQQGAEKATLAPTAPKVAPKAVATAKAAPAKADDFALKNSANKRLVEDSINTLKEKIKDKEDNAALEKRIDALKKKNFLTALAKPGANKKMAVSEKKLSALTTAKTLTQQSRLYATQTAQQPSDQPTAMDKDETEYSSTIKDRIEWTYPASFNNDNINIVVSIQIGRDGKLLDRRVEKSSERERIVQSLLDAITKAAPFPPPPKSLVKDGYFEIGFSFCPSCTEQKVTIKKP